MPPVADCCLIMLSQAIVFWANHDSRYGQFMILDAASMKVGHIVPWGRGAGKVGTFEGRMTSSFLSSRGGRSISETDA
jgi:hypothetical protein